MALPVGCASHLGIGVEPNSWLKARPATRLGGAVAGTVRPSGAGSRASDTRWRIVCECRPVSGAYAGRTGPSTRLPRSGLFTTTPASPSHASLLALQTCRGWNGRKRGQSPPSEPWEQGAGGGCCHVKSLDGPMDDNQAAQACFEPSRCRLARRFAHERDEMDRQTARITGEQCARRLQMCGWTLGSVDAATSGML